MWRARIRVEQRVAARELAVLGGDGPVLDADALAAGQRVRPGDEVARGQDVRVVDAGERGIALDAGVQREPGQPRRVQNRAEAGDDHVRVDAGGGRAEAQLDAVLAVQVRAQRAELG